ncbi:MAG: efflux RND transporter periplasmic adaptor subunit, partial [Planctomycetia bacterium]|nr:efflux RND transporter periplasmic adaptor subunit [Planctomycetia bacterium]
KELDTDLAAARSEQERVQAEATLAGVVFQQERQLYKADSTTERRFLEAQEKHRASQAALRTAGEKIRRIEQMLAARVGDDHARVAEVKAQLAEAKLNLSYTRVYAACDASITDLQLREGAYVRTGEAALTLIDLKHWTVVGNFRENALSQVAPGQPALVALRSVPGHLYQARVTAVGRGVGQGQGVPSGRLPDVKRATSWLPPSQRFQVRLELTDAQAPPLRVGMTASVSVYTEPEGMLNDLTTAWHRVLSWFYYL